MTIEFTPELSRFIDDQVAAGRYPSPQAVVEAAVTGLAECAEDELLTEADIVAIDRAEEEGDRGECVDLDTFRASLRRRYGNK